MFILELSTVPKFPARPANLFCSARPGINILQNLYNGLTIFCGGWGGGGQKLMKNFVKYGYNFLFN